MNCRLCDAPLDHTLLDLGDQPLANAYLAAPDDPDPRYPLHVRICDNCRLVQADAVVTPQELFSEYAFFSSYSNSWLEHCRAYVKQVCRDLHLGTESQVIEVASNDGALLSCFDGPQVLGVEPARNVAEVSPVETVVDFFGTRLARTLPEADLVIANNVLGHVPDLNDFCEAFRLVLKPDGVLTVEVPWLARLIEAVEFDTIYHEHFAYFSLFAIETAFGRHGLRVFDVEVLDIHGGSLRVWACRSEAGFPTTPQVHQARRVEALGIADAQGPGFASFASRVADRLHRLREFLDKCVANDELVVGAGAPAKANTLLNAVGVSDEIAFVTDTSPHKQGRYLPGSHLPIYTPEAIRNTRPEWVLILAWNWTDEVMRNLAFVKEWGGRFVRAIPTLEVL